MCAQGAIFGLKVGLNINLRNLFSYTVLHSLLLQVQFCFSVKKPMYVHKGASPFYRFFSSKMEGTHQVSQFFIVCWLSLWQGMKRVGLSSILPAFMPAFAMWEASVFCCDGVSSRRLFQGALGALQIYRLKVAGSILTKSDPVAAPVLEYIIINLYNDRIVVRDFSVDLSVAWHTGWSRYADLILTSLHPFAMRS